MLACLRSRYWSLLSCPGVKVWLPVSGQENTGHTRVERDNRSTEQPRDMICATRHFLPPLALALNFSILLVKAMQLRSLIKVGLGGTIPQINQVVSLIFMLAVQVVISSEWYVTNSPIKIEQDLETSYPSCGVSRVRFVLLHTYPAVLLVLAFCYGVSVLKIKTNYHEGRWITAATISMMPVYVVWMLLCTFAPAHFHDAATSFAITVIGLMVIKTIH